MHEIENKIKETKAVRAETDKYGNDLVSKEIEKRSKYRRGRSYVFNDKHIYSKDPGPKTCTNKENQAKK